MPNIFLKRARKKQRLTQAALAARLGKPQSFISKLERGEITNPGVEEVKALGRELGVDPLSIRFCDPRDQREMGA